MDRLSEETMLLALSSFDDQVVHHVVSEWWCIHDISVFSCTLLEMFKELIKFLANNENSDIFLGT